MLLSVRIATDEEDVPCNHIKPSYCNRKDRSGPNCHPHLSLIHLVRSSISTSRWSSSSPACCTLWDPMWMMSATMSCSAAAVGD
jgi:hypothetical protein